MEFSMVQKGVPILILQLFLDPGNINTSNKKYVFHGRLAYKLMMLIYCLDA